MTTRKIFYNDLAEAARLYPSIAGTLRKARKLGFKVSRHCAEIGHGGHVIVHWLYVEGEKGKLTPWRHEILKGYLSVVQRAVNEVEKERSES